MAYRGCDLILSCHEAETDHAKWLETRNAGIGGSDASVIMGLNPYKSPYQLWLEKTGQVEPPDLSDNQYVYWGAKNEANIADWFQEETGKKVKRLGTLQSMEYPFMLANVDRTVIGENAGLEIKTAGVSQYRKWKDDEIPDAYYCQCLHYMAVTGADYWYIAVLLGGNEALWKKINRNEADIAILTEAERAFWDIVQKRTPPAIDGSESCASALREIYHEGKDEEIILDGFDQLIDEINQDTETINKLKENIQLRKNKIMLAMGHAERAVTANHKITWKAGKPRETVSLAKIKKGNTDIYEMLKSKNLISVSETPRILRIR